MEEILFKDRLSETVRKARLHQNFITREEIEELFENSLSPEQTTLVEDYLKGLGIQTGISGEEVEEPVLDGPDVSFLQMYLDEIAGLSKLSDEELRGLKQAALLGDEEAKHELANSYLPKVVEIAKLYTGQGVPLEDLIGEGNIGLMMGLELLSCVESVDEVEGHLGKMVMDAMDAAIARGNEDLEFDRRMLLKVSQIADKAKELSEIFCRDVTISEISKESCIPEEEILQALEMTGNKIEGIMVDTEV